MRQVYVKHLSKKYAVSGDAYLEDNPVPPGKVLTVHRSSAWFDNFGTSEFVRWYIKLAAQRLWLGDDKPGSTSGPAQRDLQCTIGEGMSLGVYSPDITTDEIFHLVITGCIFDLETWRMSAGD